MKTIMTKEISLESSLSGAKPLFRRILVAVDGSESSGRASQVALDLAEKYRSELFVLHAFTAPTSPYLSTFPSMSPPTPSQAEIDAYYAYARKAALGVVGATASEAKKRRLSVKPEVREAVSSIVETIVDYAANEKIDLIVIGTRGLGGFKKILIGSVSSGVITHAQCPVLVVR